MLAEAQAAPQGLQPMYNTTEKMKARFLDSKSLNKLMRNIKELRGVEKVERIDSIQEFH